MKNNNQSRMVTFTKQMLIDELVLQLDGTITPEDVKTLFRLLESNIIKHLGSATKKQSVKIKLFNGIYFSAEYQPATKPNELITIPEHIRYKAKITTYLKTKLNNK